MGIENKSLPEINSSSGKVVDVSYQAVFEAIPYILIMLDDNCRVKALNPTAETFFGSGKNIKACLLWDLAPFLMDSRSSIEKALADGKTQILRSIKYKGTEDNYINVSVCPYFKNNEKGIVILIDDVTEQEKKEQYIRRSQKMELVGTLAAGLSHDFNNVINGVKATVSSIKFSLDNKSLAIDSLRGQVRDDIEIIEDSANRGFDIVEQLLSISRKKDLAFVPVDLVTVLGNVRKVCGNSLPRTVEMILDIREEKAMVDASFTQLEQVLLNLCVNASHAMTIMRKEGETDGGTLTLSLEKIYVGPNMCEFIPDATAGFYWLISVSDTGIGMTREVMAKIFDPFFSTKEKKGTGLGLSMVYNIVKEHKGFIDVFSEPGAGSVFFVFLPVHDEPAGNKV